MLVFEDQIIVEMMKNKINSCCYSPASPLPLPFASRTSFTSPASASVTVTVSFLLAESPLKIFSSFATAAPGPESDPLGLGSGAMCKPWGTVALGSSVERFWGGFGTGAESVVWERVGGLAAEDVG